MNLATAPVLHRAIVTVEQLAYTTAWGVDRPAATETLYVGPTATTEELAVSVRSELNWLRDDAKVTVVVQTLDAAWKDVAP